MPESLSSSGNEFQTAGLAVKKASRQVGVSLQNSALHKSMSYLLTYLHMLSFVSSQQ